MCFRRFRKDMSDLGQFFSTNTDSTLFLTPLRHAPYCEDYEVCTLLSKIHKYRRSRNYNLFSAVICYVFMSLDSLDCSLFHESVSPVCVGRVEALNIK